MLEYRDNFLINNTTEGIAVCGWHCGGDAIHVGLFWNFDEERKVVHFLNGRNIPVEDVNNNSFQDYLFNPIVDFPTDFLPSLSGLCELISQNKLNGFIFNRVGVVYDGGKFDFQSGAYTTKTPAEKFVNCGIFVIALLMTYDYTLLDWNSWPNVNPTNLSFLNQWLDNAGIPGDQRQPYYNMTKEVRERHVLVCPGTQLKPSTYTEVLALSEELINQLNS